MASSALESDLAHRRLRTLARLARGPYGQSGDVQAAYREIAEQAAVALDLARVGVWLVAPDRDSMACAELFDRSTGSHSSGAVVTRAEHPAYFAALDEERTIAADDAHRDARTASLVEGYLVPLQIGALLDAPILEGGRSAGVVCHEHRGGPRVWTLEEQMFAGSMADFTALARESARRRAAELLLAERDADLRFALAAAGMVPWRWRPDADSWEWPGDGLPGFFPGGPPATTSALLAQVKPDDRHRLAQGLALQRTGPGALLLEDEAHDQDEAGAPLWIEVRLCHPGPLGRWVQFRGRPDPSGRGLAGVLVDVDASKRLEARVAGAARTEAVAKVASGVAHDFNNLLTAIAGQAELLEETLADAAPRASLKLISRSVERATVLTRQLLAMARQQEATPRRIDVVGRIAELRGALERLCGQDTALRVELPEARLEVEVDPGELDQLLVNLVTQTRAGGAPAGTLQLAVESVSLDWHEAQRLQLRKGDYVAITLCAGAGAEPVSLGRPELSVSPGGLVTHRWQGELGSGWRLLALRTRSGSSLPPAAPVPRPGRSGGRLLLVDDERSLRELCADALQDAGYATTVVADGEAARHLLAQGLVVDAVITDLTLPGMDGLELAELAKKHLPGVRVLVASGYQVEPSDARQRQYSWLAKPFSLKDLVSRVDDLLAAPAAPPPNRPE